MYGLTIFLSAFLLFQVQLILGKALLPWFGGAAGVWTTCMLFFQTLLLAGYAYADRLVCLKSTRRAASIHCGILILAIIGLCWPLGSGRLPLLPGDTLMPSSDGSPILQILAVLGLTAGLPFFALSATSPLLQRWFSRQYPQHSPYRLFALSNAGSLLGLLSYPLFVEPLVSVRAQAGIWTVLFIIFGCLCARAALASSTHVAPPVEHQPERRTTASAWTVMRVIGLATVTSGLFLSVTNLLCQEVASVPFLWILPMAIYLLTFIISFDRPAWYRREWFGPLAALASLAALIAALQGVYLGVVSQIITNGLFLFIICLACHGELARLQPVSTRLTAYYLQIAFGGALGGLLVAVVAPLMLNDFREFHLILLAAWILLAAIWVHDRTSPFHHPHIAGLITAVAFITFLSLRLLTFYGPDLLVRPAADVRTKLCVAGTIAITAFVVFALRNRRMATSPAWLRFVVGFVILMAEIGLIIRIHETNEEAIIAAQRNFYGVIRIKQEPTHEDSEPAIHMIHGAILHGMQFVDDSKRQISASYYAPGSGIEQVIRHHPDREQRELTIGVMGLGAGTISALTSPGDSIRFYEINPIVIDLASRGRPLFSFLQDSPAAVSVVKGDARLTMEREGTNENAPRFDVLAMDAFSSDSIPVHLLTREAFAMYLNRLRDHHSVIAINISNRFIDLQPPLLAIAAEFDLNSRIIAFAGKGVPGAQPSRWLLLSRSQWLADSSAFTGDIAHTLATAGRLWTDDYSNILSLLK